MPNVCAYKDGPASSTVAPSHTCNAANSSRRNGGSIILGPNKGSVHVSSFSHYQNVAYNRYPLRNILFVTGYY
jgi:hypothetical protein